MLPKINKLSVHFNSRFFIRFVSFFWGFEETQISLFSICCYLGDISDNAVMVSFGDTFIASSVVRSDFSVKSIFNVSCFSKVLPSVIIFNHIAVIDLIFWPLASHPQPRNAMRCIGATVNFNADITDVMVVTGNASGSSSSARLCPSQQSRHRIVMKNLAKFFGCDKVAISHSDLLHGSLGKRLAGVGSVGVSRFVGVEA